MEQTYNQYIMKGLLDETIKEYTQNGVRILIVRRPRSTEMVMGYTNFSATFIPQTITQEANQS